MRKTNQKGFTIIELLVVIVIIGILVALALPQLFAAQARGRDADRKNDLKNLQQKLETYFNDNDKYPTSISASGFADANITADDMKGPRDTTYTYTCTSTPNDPCQSYELSATLENKKDKDANNGVYTLRSVNQPESSNNQQED